MKWYVVHTYSGYEEKAKSALLDRIKNNNVEAKFGEILVPKPELDEMTKAGKRKQSKPFFPSYMLVQMDLTDETWHVVKQTPKVTGFVGNSAKPVAVSDKEVQRLTQQISEGALQPELTVQFEQGENIRVIEGPFANFNGVVDDVKPEKAKVRVLVSIFGRSTPVELDFSQVEKAD